MTETSRRPAASSSASWARWPPTTTPRGASPSTLRIFLEEGASFVRAARRLGVHTNTVTYRVHRAEELLGHPVTERQLELHVALRLVSLVDERQQ